MATKRSGSQAKSGGGAKRGKSKAKRELKDLDVKNATGIRGGIVCRKAGKGQQEF
jgi:hypothetical protein